MNKTRFTLAVLMLCLFTKTGTAQIVGTDGFLMGEGLEVGIHNQGYEGSSVLPPFPTHYRGTTGRLGFLANPQADGWTNYNGDYFMPGSPQNCFGIEVDGVTYHNSADPFMGSTIPATEPMTHYAIDKCKFIEWHGMADGIDIDMTYKMDSTEHYYKVIVTLTNTTMEDKSDVYFYKSLDPDNNQDIGWGFATLNRIAYQPSPDCPKALVTATDNNGWESYIGLGGLGEQMRVSYGGFYVDDASDIWTGGAPHTVTPGAEMFSDQAISICHRDEMIGAGESSTFEFVVVMNDTQVDEALLEMIHFTYDEGAAPTESCSDTTGYVVGGDGITYETDGIADTIWRCTIEPSVLYVEAPGEVISEYNLAWLDMDEGDTLSEEAYTTIIEGTEADTAHVICFLTLGDCFGGVGLANEYVIITQQSPEIYIPEPGVVCGESALLADIEILDTAEVDGVETTYHATYPESETDMDDLWPTDDLTAGDTVYVMMVNPETDCYDVDTIVVEFNTVSAGEDGEGPEMCTTEDVTLNLNDYLTDADPDGVWVAVEPVTEPALEEATGLFTVTGLPTGVYEFFYIVGEEPCIPDTAVIKVDLSEPYTAGADGAIEVCSAEGLMIDLNELLDGNDPGGTWVEVAVTEAFDAETGMLDVSELPIGSYLYEYVSMASGPCPEDVASFVVTVAPGPTADFSFTPPSLYTDDTEAVFTNTSTGATYFRWDFGDETPLVYEENPTHEFPEEAGIYNIRLYVENDLGCADSTIKSIKVNDITLFYMPNTFTPDGDSHNDVFQPVFESGFDPYSFHMRVYNRYGEIVFESYDASAGWDGTYGSEGIVPAGIYTWSLEFKEENTDRIHQHTGHITLIK